MVETKGQKIIYWLKDVPGVGGIDPVYVTKRLEQAAHNREHMIGHRPEGVDEDTWNATVNGWVEGEVFAREGTPPVIYNGILSATRTVGYQGEIRYDDGADSSTYSLRPCTPVESTLEGVITKYPHLRSYLEKLR